MAKKRMKLWEIDEWCNEVSEKIYMKVSLFTIDVLTATIKFSPKVGVAPFATGRFVANWNVSPTKNTTTSIQTMTATQKINEITTQLSPDYFKNYNVVHMTNSLDYADKVENKGWSRGPDQAYAPVAKTYAYIRTKYL